MALYNEIGYGKLMDALGLMKAADFQSRECYRMKFLEDAATLLSNESGLDLLLLLAPQFDESLLFLGGPWENPAALNPSLVNGTLKAGGLTFVYEALSNLRMLSIALGHYKHQDVSIFSAKKFLNEAVAQGIECLFPTETEEARIKGIENYREMALLFNYLLKHLSPFGLLNKITEEIEKLTVQRPIITDKILTLIHSGKKLCGQLDDIPKHFRVFAKRIISKNSDWEKQPEQELNTAAREMGEEMQATGLVSPRHCDLILYLNSKKPEFMPIALGLGREGEHRWNCHKNTLKLLIERSFTSLTRQAAYGLACLLEREELTVEIVHTLLSVTGIQPCAKITALIRNTYTCGPEMVRPFLISGLIQLLGQPLGVGQGFNPTCQSTRALCYWSQKNPAFLMELYLKALTQGHIELGFEGYTISSHFLQPVELDHTVPMDPVSVVLVPHLHAIYGEMIKRASNRLEDVHKWINPAFYHTGVLEGFAQCGKHPDFQTLFTKYYHPENRYMKDLLPQPAGIIIYDSKGIALGAHAVLIQRIAKDLHGQVRVYFYNPNNDSKQTWGKDMVTSVAGNGERHGEASLQIDQFLACLYAFHYPLG